MRKLIKIQLSDGSWLFGWEINGEMVLPSGYTMPIENGKVQYQGVWYTVQDGNA